MDMNDSPKPKTRKILALDRERLKQLNQAELTAAVGGAAFFTTKCTQAHGTHGGHDCTWNWSTFLTDVF